MSSTTTTTRPAIAARKPLGHLGASHLDSAAQFHAVPPRIGKHLSLQLLASRAWRSIGTIVAITEKKSGKVPTDASDRGKVPDKHSRD